MKFLSVVVAGLLAFVEVTPSAGIALQVKQAGSAALQQLNSANLDPVVVALLTQNKDEPEPLEKLIEQISRMTSAAERSVKHRRKLAKASVKKAAHGIGKCKEGLVVIRDREACQAYHACYAKAADKYQAAVSKAESGLKKAADKLGGLLKSQCYASVVSAEIDAVVDGSRSPSAEVCDKQDFEEEAAKKIQVRFRKVAAEPTCRPTPPPATPRAAVEAASQAMVRVAKLQAQKAAVKSATKGLTKEAHREGRKAARQLGRRVAPQIQGQVRRGMARQLTRRLALRMSRRRARLLSRAIARLAAPSVCRTISKETSKDFARKVVRKEVPKMTRKAARSLVGPVLHGLRLDTAAASLCKKAIQLQARRGHLSRRAAARGFMKQLQPAQGRRPRRRYGLVQMKHQHLGIRRFFQRLWGGIKKVARAVGRAVGKVVKKVVKVAKAVGKFVVKAAKAVVKVVKVVAKFVVESPIFAAVGMAVAGVLTGGAGFVAMGAKMAVKYAVKAGVKAAAKALIKAGKKKLAKLTLKKVAKAGAKIVKEEIKERAKTYIKEKIQESPLVQRMQNSVLQKVDERTNGFVSKAIASQGAAVALQAARSGGVSKCLKSLRRNAARAGLKSSALKTVGKPLSRSKLRSTFKVAAKRSLKPGKTRAKRSLKPGKTAAKHKKVVPRKKAKKGSRARRTQELDADVHEDAGRARTEELDADVHADAGRARTKELDADIHAGEDALESAEKELNEPEELHDAEP